VCENIVLHYHTFSTEKAQSVFINIISILKFPSSKESKNKNTKHQEEKELMHILAIVCEGERVRELTMYLSIASMLEAECQKQDEQKRSRRQI
jgi:hypothetical protein